MQHLFSVNRYKAEAPVIATFFVMALLGSLYFYPSFRWYAFLLFPLMAALFVVLRKLKVGFFSRKCFIFLDDAGIRYCLHVYQQPTFIAWDQIDRITYQMYEINIKIKESGHVICLQVGYLNNPEEFQELKGILDAKKM